MTGAVALLFATLATARIIHSGNAACPTPRAGGDPSDAIIARDLAKEISKVDESHYVITRAGLDRLIDSKLIERSVSLIETRKPTGIKLCSIRPESILTHLGLQNGDLIVMLNDVDQISPSALLEAYRKGRGTGLVRVSLQRQGKPVTLEIAVR